MTDQNVRQLPRGGLLISTGMGPVQFGIPPETIKDTMAAGVPDLFIVPRFMFSLEKGISMAELEFPVYYNFFFHGKKIRVVCTRFQEQRLKLVLSEALFGPAEPDYESEFLHGRSTPGFPDLEAEMAHFKTMPVNGVVKQLALSDVVEFYTFGPDGTVRIGELTVHTDETHTYTIKDRDGTLAVIDRHHPLIPSRKIDFRSRNIFDPPLFGVTTLGAGHGFDPDAMTSGMIIWINRRGIMVDPPVNSAVDLVRLGVNPKILDAIILTHCHADHDSGTLQKLMMEAKVTLYTTPTIFNSFMRKSSALTDIAAGQLEKAVHFVPLTIGSPVNIHGGLFRFHYSFHSIPTIGFQAGYAGKTMVYSSDTHNDPAYIRRLYESGKMDKNRHDFLRDFPWDRDLIFHEAGTPPLHTPMDYLMSLPEDVRRRIYLIHVTQSTVPGDSGLKIAPTGLSSTVSLEVGPSRYAGAIELLSVYLDIPLFHSLPPEKTMEFLSIANPDRLAPGTVLFKKGDKGDAFYLIMSGQVDILEDDSLLTTLSRSDYFGEKCLFSDAPRTADAIARSHVRFVSVKKEAMRIFIRNTDLEKVLYHLSEHQHKTLRKILDANPVFQYLTPSQKIQLFQIIAPVDLSEKEGKILVREGEPADAGYFIDTGQVRVFRKNCQMGNLSHGDLFGISPILKGHALAEHTFAADPDTCLYRFGREDLENFANTNPGVLLKLYCNPF